MRPHRIRAARRVGVAWLLATLLATMSLSTASAAGVSRPTGLSSSAKETLLAGMSARERALRAPLFRSSRYVVVSYARSVERLPAVRAGQVRGGPSRAGRISTMAITNLTTSVAVAYDSEAPKYRWDISGFFDWKGKPPNNGNGNDQIAVAWAHGLALHSDLGYGYYTDGKKITMNRNDMTPNVGTSWEFKECNLSYCNSYANWGYLLATIKETTRHNDDTNVVFKYFHTIDSTSFSIGFSASGPSISISPSANVTSTTVYTDFVD
jgi:hypothetical protein